jgi:transcriptional regulator with XRE-family HTH domain
MYDKSMMLKTVRISKGMTQQNVADEAGIGLRQYQKFESGERKLINASFWTGAAVLQALGIDVSNYCRCNKEDK